MEVHGRIVVDKLKRHGFVIEEYPKNFSVYVRITKELKVYKKVEFGGIQDAIATMIIPIHSRAIFKWDGYGSILKCRASKAKVTRIMLQSSRKDVQQARSLHDSHFVYRVGRNVVPDYFTPDFRICAGGIHFFLTKKEAERY